MSLEFNRRSFLKYSAAAAVAVAGSSLLVGCGEDEYQKTGKIGSTLKLMGAFDTRMSSPNAPDIHRSPLPATTGTTPATGAFKCNLSIKCTYGQAWSLRDYRSLQTSRSTVTPKDSKQ